MRPRAPQIDHHGAEMSIDTSSGRPEMDYREHVRTYDGFIKGTIGLVVATVVVLIGMAIFLL